MAYILEKKEEASRLEAQALMAGYSIPEELRFLKVPSHAKILDAGCGSGVLTRYLAENYLNVTVEGCDGSEHRIAQAKTLCEGFQKQQQIHYYISPLEKLATASSYDLITCRYVYEHLTDHKKVTQEFFRALRPGGCAYLIDFDGIIYNLHHQNERLEMFLTRMKNGLGLDLYIGRKMPRLLMEAGFENVQWHAETIQFQGEDLENEHQLTLQRFTFALPAFEKLFGSLDEAVEFRDLYCSEMMKFGNSLFYTKFIAWGTKPKFKTI